MTQATATRKPEITYDFDANALYVKVRGGKIDHTDVIGEGQVVVDVREDGRIAGVEILYGE